MIQIDRKADCCGCAACVQICPKLCISMQSDSEGFLYPQVDKSMCINCGLCEKVCQVFHPMPFRNPDAVFAAINEDEDIRLHSSSGGIFTELAEAVIRKRG